MTDLDIGPKSHWPKSLLELFEVAANALEVAGKPIGEAAECAAIMILAVGEYHGGRMFYLPSGKALKTASKHAQIWKEFDGRNVLELARKHDLSEQEIYRIITKQRALASGNKGN